VSQTDITAPADSAQKLISDFLVYQQSTLNSHPYIKHHLLRHSRCEGGNLKHQRVSAFYIFLIFPSYF